ncbi:terpene synthase family protein [Actinomadura hibisca]|uniref:terpene synthase family protein n=1 Tax=Actinomadura hibisca TaxID=68565 RepID=UPI000837592E|nr:terpene synthase family protein [Actinomadura hibisca]
MHEFADNADARQADRDMRLLTQIGEDLHARMRAHPDLFPERPLGTELAVKLAQPLAWGAPWCSAEELRPAARAALWIFALDWIVDHQATEAGRILQLVDQCLDVADGADPANSLGALLAEVRDELAGHDAFEQLRPLWRAELERMLRAMAREWDWKTTLASSPPGAPAPITLDQYLDNAANFGSTWVNVCHWIRQGDPVALRHLAALVPLSDTVQRMLRLYNDQATLHRDRGWGDLNAHMIADADQLGRRLRDLTDRFEHECDALRAACPHEVDYLSRQLAFSRDFYGAGNDYWGQL